jgi:hypothetical protein
VEAHFGSRYSIIEVHSDQGKSGSKDTEKRAAFLKMIHDLGEWLVAGRSRSHGARRRPGSTRT